MNTGNAFGQVLDRSASMAESFGHRDVTPVHLALALVKDDRIAAYLSQRGTDLEQLKSTLHSRIEEVSPSVDAAQDGEQIAPVRELEALYLSMLQGQRARGNREPDTRDILQAILARSTDPISKLFFSAGLALTPEEQAQLDPYRQFVENRQT